MNALNAFDVVPVALEDLLEPAVHAVHGYTGVLLTLECCLRRTAGNAPTGSEGAGDAKKAAGHALKCAGDALEAAGDALLQSLRATLNRLGSQGFANAALIDSSPHAALP